MRIHRPRRFRWPWTPRSGTAESNAGTLSCLKRWVVALHGARQRSGIEKIQESGECRIVDTDGFCYEGESTLRGPRRTGREIIEWPISASRGSRTTLKPMAL